MLAHGDGEADTQLAAGGDNGAVVEAAVGSHGEFPSGSSVAHSSHRFPQEVSGAPGRIGSTLAQAGHEHVAGASSDGEQLMIAALAGIAVWGQAVLHRPTVGPAGELTGALFS